MAKKNVENPIEDVQEASKKMTQKDAEAIVAKYDGINGNSNEPAELAEARLFLKS